MISTVLKSIFTNIKTYLIIAFVVFISVILFSAYYYKNNNEKLLKDIETNTKMIKQLNESLEKEHLKYKETVKAVNEQSKQIKEITKKANDYKNEAEEIKSKFNSDRINNIADRKPKLLEKALTSGLNKELQELNELTKNKR